VTSLGEEERDEGRLDAGAVSPDGEGFDCDGRLAVGGSVGADRSTDPVDSDRDEGSPFVSFCGLGRPFWSTVEEEDGGGTEDCSDDGDDSGASVSFLDAESEFAVISSGRSDSGAT
jgi:hypothetical protein